MVISAHSIRIKGQVQGVGFRPFVYNLAERLSVCGSVNNGPLGVSIHAQAEPTVLKQFESLLVDEQPAMSLIETIEVTLTEVDDSLSDFSIRQSETGELDLGVTPDAAVCHQCLSELFDPDNRRYQYPFINCTHCGPRYSLIKALPYDRAQTTMADFTLCQPCLHEYQSSQDRRFHAQPNACAECGPTLTLYNAEGNAQDSLDPVADTLSLLQTGKVVAIKGIGGFHLVCDAHNNAAVQRLRALKNRDAKPFAVMALNPQSLSPYIELTPERIQRLQAMDAPIVLSPRKVKQPQDKALPLSEEIAPGLAWMGAMLPHSPIHYLLFNKAAGEPTGTAWLEDQHDLILVMTSANRSGNPLVFENTKALTELKGIADSFLMHNREIYTRCDDSVVSTIGKKPALIRRGRGLSPQFIPLSYKFSQLNKSVLAVGSFYKSTVCLTKGDRAYVSQYIGDLDNPECCRALSETVEHLKSLLDINPDVVVSDRHPDFYSSHFADCYSTTHQIPLIKVQHHHAHIAAVIAEHLLDEPVLGLALDGLGLGSDGGLWGGELLRVHQGAFERIAHLSSLAMPGGERAAKEPWRMASGALYDLGQSDDISERFSQQQGAEIISQLLEKQLNCPQTTSAGRLFDAVAGLLGITDINQYEAQAAMMLESLAYTYLQAHPWPDEPLLVELTNGNLNCLPLLKRLSLCDDAVYGATLFHQQMVEGLVTWVCEHSAYLGLNKVVLAGGCFLNQILTNELQQRLKAKHLDVFCAQKLPCNDGAISLGQAQIALEIELGKTRSSEPNTLNKNTSNLDVIEVTDIANSAEIKLCV